MLQPERDEMRKRCQMAESVELPVSKLIEMLDHMDKTAASMETLKGEVLVAAGMLSTTGVWADQHPDEALAFIRESAAEIAAKDKRYADEMAEAKHGKEPDADDVTSQD